MSNHSSETKTWPHQCLKHNDKDYNTALTQQSSGQPLNYIYKQHHNCIHNPRVQKCMSLCHSHTS